MWIVQPMQIATASGTPSGRWRMTARNSCEGNVPLGEESHDHESAEEAKRCALCDEFVCRLSGLPTRREREAQKGEGVKDTLLRFGQMVEKQARQNMTYTGKVEGAHYAAMRTVFPAFGINYDEDIAKIVTAEEDAQTERPLLILPETEKGKKDE